MTNELTNNPDLFFHLHKDDNGDVSEVCIDFHSIISFCKTEEMDGSIELAVKFVNESKAYYSFYEAAPYARFVTEYNDFVSRRTEIVSVAREMAKDIAREMAEQNKETTKALVQETVSEIRKTVAEEIVAFKDEIEKQASNIVSTALQHQKDINKESDHLLSNIKEQQDEARQFVSDINGFKERLSGITQVLDMIAPSSKSARMEEEEEKKSIREEVSSF